MGFSVDFISCDCLFVDVLSVVDVIFIVMSPSLGFSFDCISRYCLSDRVVSVVSSLLLLVGVRRRGRHVSGVDLLECI